MPRPAQAGAPDSQFRGVSWDESKRMWRARIYIGTPRRQVHIGRFPTEVEAAQAYDCFAAAFREQGEHQIGGLNFGLDEALRQLPAFQACKAFASARARLQHQGRSEAPAAIGGVRKPAAAAASRRKDKAARVAQGAACSEAAGVAPPRACAAAGPQRSRKATRASQPEARGAGSDGGGAMEPQTPPAVAAPQQQDLLLHRLGQVQRTRQQQEQRLKQQEQQRQQQELLLQQEQEQELQLQQLQLQQLQLQQLQLQQQPAVQQVPPPPAPSPLLPLLPLSEQHQQRPAPQPLPVLRQQWEERQLLRWRLERELQLRRQQLEELQQLAQALAVPLEPWQDQLQGMLRQAAEAPPLIPALASSSDDTSTMVEDIWSTALGYPALSRSRPMPQRQQHERMPQLQAPSGRAAAPRMQVAGRMDGFGWLAPAGAGQALERVGSCASDGTYASFAAPAPAVLPCTAAAMAAQRDAPQFAAAPSGPLVMAPAASPAMGRLWEGAFDMEEGLAAAAGLSDPPACATRNHGWCPAGPFACASADGAQPPPAPAHDNSGEGGPEAIDDELLRLLVGWLDDTP